MSVDGHHAVRAKVSVGCRRELRIAAGSIIGRRGWVADHIVLDDLIGIEREGGVVAAPFVQPSVPLAVVGAGQRRALDVQRTIYHNGVHGVGVHCDARVLIVELSDQKVHDVVVCDRCLPRLLSYGGSGFEYHLTGRGFLHSRRVHLIIIGDGFHPRRRGQIGGEVVNQGHGTRTECAVVDVVEIDGVAHYAGSRVVVHISQGRSSRRATSGWAGCRLNG